jgi:hypothetical protein
MSFLSGLSIAVIGLICLVLFGTFYWLKIFATTRAILAFVGVCLLGAGGIAGRIFTDITTWVAHLLGIATQLAFGVQAGALLLLIPVGAMFLYDLHPKHSAGTRTGWAGIALAVLLVTGLSGIQGLNAIPGAVRTGVTNVQTSLGG